jgi:lysophospholipase L1-like esterase
VQRTAKGIKEYEVVAKPFNAQFQGIAQRYFTAEEGARVSVKGSKSRKHLTTWQRCILYLRTESGIDVATTLNGDTTLREHLSGSPSVQMLVCEEDTVRSLEQRYSAITPATHLFGVAMEPRRGIVVDNFSLRGSAGFTIGQVPLHTLQDFSRLRPYDLMVFHFGLNVANAKSGAASYQAYIKHMQKAIDHVRQAYPQTSVLVVSMPDRDQRTAEGIKTMKGVESLVAYQQILASDCHVAYFNLFEAMGGRESMKALVDQGLANKDYTHLSFGGGRKIAKYLFDSLMAGFENYKRRH